jgi:FxsC-like protein
MSLDFFFSYKRVSETAYQRKFFEDLSNEVRALRELDKKVQVGFFDQRIDPGEEWEPRLAEALQDSRVLVCAYSPRYFESEYCGKEWQVFRMRRDLYVRQRQAQGQAAAVPPTFIRPVLWLPLPENLDPESTRLQVFRGTAEEVGNREGLRYVLQRRGSFRKLYTDYINQLARDIVAMRELDLPRLPNLPSLRDVQSAFTAKGIAQSPRSESAAAVAAGSGSKHVSFVFVAGDPAKFGGLRQPEAYLQRGGPDWKPFHPMQPDRIARLVQHFVSEEEMDYDSDIVPFNENTDFVRLIQDAYRDRKIVVLIVDAWTLSWDANCQQRLSTFDTRNKEAPFYNCSVLVPWNDSDLELKDRRQEIINRVRTTFHSRANLFRNPVFYRDSITSVEELHEALRDALTNIRAELHSRADERKPVPQTVPKPVISNHAPVTAAES